MMKTEPSLRVVVEKGDFNKNVRQFHFSKQISNSAQLFFLPLRNSSERYLDEVGSVGSKILQRLNDFFMGIEKISISRYSLEVEIGKAFSWSEDSLLWLINDLSDILGCRVDQMEIIRNDLEKTEAGVRTPDEASTETVSAE